jgi:branched-chain amino acid aminotransferase
VTTGPIDDGSKIYMDGHLVPVTEANVSVFDHAFLYGDGIFETLMVVEGRVFRLQDHLQRLQRSAKAIALHLPVSIEEIREAILLTVSANGWPMSFVKAIVSRGAGQEPVLEHRGLAAQLTIITRPSMPFHADGVARAGLSAAIVGTRKTPFAALDPRIKSLNYLNVITSRIEARNLGADESILLDDLGRVVEASIYNVIAVHENRLTTPRDGCLEGITLDTTLTNATRLGLAVERSDVYPYDLATADEIIFKSTAVGLLPVVSMNGRAVGSGHPGKVYEQLHAAYEGSLRDPLQTTMTELATQAHPAT